jgi:hypothetical protein
MNEGRKEGIREKRYLLEHSYSDIILSEGDPELPCAFCGLLYCRAEDGNDGEPFEVIGVLCDNLTQQFPELFSSLLRHRGVVIQEAGNAQRRLTVQVSLKE